MRRLVPATRMALSDIDTARDATVLLVGRGGAYPTLSVSLGEQTGVVGALSIEAAAQSSQHPRHRRHRARRRF